MSGDARRKNERIPDSEIADHVRHFGGDRGLTTSQIVAAIDICRNSAVDRLRRCEGLVLVKRGAVNVWKYVAPPP